jgi:hypothetical protein
MNPPAASRSRTRLLGATWLLASLVLALPGWLLLALSEGRGGRLAGCGLAAVAVLALVAGVSVIRSGQRALRLSYATSGLLALAGLAALVGVAADGPLFGRDAVLLGGLPVLLAGVTALLAASVARRAD